MIVKEIKYKDQVFTGYKIDLGGAPLILVKAKHGYIMCGYLDINTAEKLKDSACIVRGVSQIDEILKNKVTDLTGAAKKKRIKIGMTGLQALLRLNKPA